MQTVIIDRPSGKTYDDDDSTASDNCTDDDSIIRINEWNNNESTASDSTNSHAGHTSPLWRRPRWRSLALHGRRAHGTSYSNYNYKHNLTHLSAVPDSLVFATRRVFHEGISNYHQIAKQQYQISLSCRAPTTSSASGSMGSQGRA